MKKYKVKKEVRPYLFAQFSWGGGHAPVQSHLNTPVSVCVTLLLIFTFIFNNVHAMTDENVVTDLLLP